jgi:hypothetical protein
MNNEEIKRKRLEEIELKKKRLEEMRKNRGNAAQSSASDVSAPLSSLNELSVESKSNKETDNVISSLLGSSSKDPASHKGDHSTTSFTASSSSSSAAFRQEKAKHFGYQRFPNEIIEIQSKNKVTYNKECQTESVEEEDREEEKREIRGKEGSFSSPASSIRKSAHKGLNPVSLKRGSSLEVEGGSLHHHHSLHFEDDRSSSSLVGSSAAKKGIDSASLVGESSFKEFLQVSSLRIEREMEFLDCFNSMREITGEKNKERDDHKGSSSSLFTLDGKYEEDTVKSRPILCLQSHPSVPHLFLTCHGPSSSTAASHGIGTAGSGGDGGLGGGKDDDESGLICIWSKDLHRRCETKLFSSSPVLIASFYNPIESGINGNKHLIV